MENRRERELQRLNGRERSGAKKSRDWSVWVFFGNIASIAFAYKVSNKVESHSNSISICFWHLNSLVFHSLLSPLLCVYIHIRPHSTSIQLSPLVFYSNNDNDNDDGKDDVHLQIFKWISSTITTGWYTHFIIISSLLFSSVLNDNDFIHRINDNNNNDNDDGMRWIFFSHLSCQVEMKQI